MVSVEPVTMHPAGSTPEGFFTAGVEYRKESSEQGMVLSVYDGGTRLTLYFAPMEGITDGILRQTHSRIFGGIDVYCLPFHKLNQTDFMEESHAGIL